MYLNLRNGNGNLNRKHGRLTCSSVSLLHLLDICFKNQNTAVFKAPGVGARRETHPCPTQGVYSWGWFICRWNYRANYSRCWKYLVTVQRFPDWNPSSSSNMVWAYCTGKTPETRLCPLGKNKHTKCRLVTPISFGGGALHVGGNLIACSLRWFPAGLPGIRKSKLNFLCLLTWQALKKEWKWPKKLQAFLMLPGKKRKKAR